MLTSKADSLPLNSKEIQMITNVILDKSYGKIIVKLLSRGFTDGSFGVIIPP